ncbi:MAG: gluconate 2-dehydrogenase subunit 3 family protein, partial [Flavobacteriia bacterium]|nr:gluconate 2-dehydrogenase subunit 3 family protein [Flavobacteriia bacterium]
ITRLANLILPPHENGSIEEAEVPGFIEFIVKDIPSLQAPMRSGLAWIEKEAKQRFGDPFIGCSEADQKSLLDDIAFEIDGLEKQPEEIVFFALIRNLVMTGYFTSAVGIKDLGYQGNSPNVWDGIPEEVLEKHQLSYDPEWLAKCVDQSTRNEMAMWDENGNLIS